jgi:hypothetical protein
MDNLLDADSVAKIFGVSTRAYRVDFCSRETAKLHPTPKSVQSILKTGRDHHRWRPPRSVNWPARTPGMDVGGSKYYSGGSGSSDRNLSGISGKTC